MTVSTATSRVDYTGNGVTTAFAVPFPFIEDSYLTVIRTVIATGVETTLVLNSGGADGYTVTGAGQATGTVTVVTAPSVAQRLSIIRAVPGTQEADFVANDPFPAETFEDSLDKLQMQINDNATRAIRSPVLFDSDIDGSGRYNSNGNRYADAADAVNAQDLVTLAQLGNATNANAPFIQAGTGAVARTVQNKARDIVSVKDFGAVGNGTTDDTAAIQLALDYVAGGKALFFPAGIYMVSAALTGGRNTAIYGDGWRTTIKVANGANPAHILKFGDETDFTTVEVHDIEFDGNKSNNPSGGDGLVIVRGYKANLFNVRVLDCVGDGIQYEATGGCFENYIYGPSCYRNDGYGIRMAGAGVTDTHIIGGDIGFNATGGVVLATSCSVNGATIWGASQANSRGVVTAGVSFQIIGNRIEGHGQHGIFVQAGNDYGYINGNKIYANSFTLANDGLYDGIHVEAGTHYGTVSGNKVYSAVSGATPYSMRYAINFAGAHNQWTIAGNDLTVLTAGNPAVPKASGLIVNGILSTDKTDFNWLRTNVQSRISANFNASAANTWTLFPFNTDDVDILSEFSGGTFTPKATGLYRIEVAATFTAAAANENMGLALYTNAGSVIRRIDFTRSEGTNSDMLSGTIEQFLTGGTAYDIRYLTGSLSTAFLAGSELTYCRIRAVAQ